MFCKIEFPVLQDEKELRSEGALMCEDEETTGERALNRISKSFEILFFVSFCSSRVFSTW